MRRNNAIFGCIIGLVLPLLGMVIVYLILFKGFTFDLYLSRIFSDGRIAAKVITLSILTNVVPFIFYTNRKLDLTGRGLLVATMLYAVLIVLLKFVW
jgi:hypothetical protein